MSDPFPPPPNQTALSESMQFTDQSTEPSSTDDSHAVLHRPSVMDMADAFQKMEDNIRHSARAKRKIKSPKKYTNLHRNKRNPTRVNKSDDSDERSDVLMNKLKDFSKRKDTKNRISKLEDSLSRKSEEVEELQSLIKEQQQTFRNKIKNFKHQDDKIRRMSNDIRSQVDDKNVEIRRLLTKHRHKETNMKKQISTLESQIETSNHRNDAHEKDVDALKKKIKGHKEEIRVLRSNSERKSTILNEEIVKLT
eukprot:372639_1